MYKSIGSVRACRVKKPSFGSATGQNFRRTAQKKPNFWGERTDALARPANVSQANRAVDWGVGEGKANRQPRNCLKRKSLLRGMTLKGAGLERTAQNRTIWRVRGESQEVSSAKAPDARSRLVRWEGGKRAVCHAKA